MQLLRTKKSDAVEEFTATVTTHFPPWNWTEEQQLAWSKALAAQLRRFKPEEIEAGRELMVRTRKDRHIPTVADCLDYVWQGRDHLEAEQIIAKIPLDLRAGRDPVDHWSEERQKLADDLIRSPMGKEAARGNWVLALWNFARKHQRLPQPEELKAVRKEADEFDEAYAKCVRGGWGQAAALVNGLGDGILERRKELAEIALK